MLSRRSSFSEVERKMLYFTQVHPPLADIREVHAEFEREHDWNQALHALKKKRRSAPIGNGRPGFWIWRIFGQMHPASAIF
jgi:hypothetical protein